VVVFDAPAAEVSRAMLQELYANEGSLLPTQAPSYDIDGAEKDARRPRPRPSVCR